MKKKQNARIDSEPAPHEISMGVGLDEVSFRTFSLRRYVEDNPRTPLLLGILDAHLLGMCLALK